jgi:hypothetical protein
MKTDPIVEELHKHREQHAKKFNKDLKKIVADYKRSEEERVASRKKVAESTARYSSKNT